MSTDRTTIRRRDKRIWYVVTGLFVAVFLFTFLTQKYKGSDGVEAASLAEFDPGYIISDYQMGNYNSMSEAEIQAFLTAKNSCGNTNHNYYQQLTANNPGVIWHFDDGHFICLSEERFGDGEAIGSGETAAHIIWQAAQDYEINPQVLIVLLQKETSLITDPIPNNYDYRKATGYGCPDTAACSSEYYGFKNQVRNAAALFSTVLNGGWTNYPLGKNYIQYNPNAGCGGSVVNIRSLATSALYRYTPYQPNAGAIAAGYGTAYCGAYGNRNFYLYFQDWFGGITNGGIVIPSSSMVIEGEYLIKSALDGDKLLDVTEKENESNLDVKIRKKSDGVQKWIIKSNGDDSYTFVNSLSGKVLDVDGASVTKGANVQLYQSNGTCAQKWQVVRNDDGTYSIYSSCSGLVLDVSGGVANDGANINIWRENGTNAQKWKLLPVKTIENGNYVISSNASEKKVIDIESDENRANVWVFGLNYAETQEWEVQYDEMDGLYTFVNSLSGKVLDVDGASVTKGANVQLYQSNGTCAQKWQVVRNDDGTYSIYSSCSGLVLDVSGGVANDGANINIWRENGTNAQKWLFDEYVKPRGDRSGLGGHIYSVVSSIDEGKNLDILGGVEVAIVGSNIQLWHDNGTMAQEWFLRYNEDGTYTFVNPSTEKVIDVSNASTELGANIQLWRDNGTCAQKWHIEKKELGYVFRSACSLLVMDASGGVANDGTNINLWRENGTNAQLWKLKRR